MGRGVLMEAFIYWSFWAILAIGAVALWKVVRG